MRVLLIYTGGTIGMSRNVRTGALEPFSLSRLLVNVPELARFGLTIDTRQFDHPIDSSDMTPARWVELARMIADNYAVYDGFVILHGTDAMAYAASALSFMLENLDKPVILTGSQLPIGQLRTDGKENLITAVEMASARRVDGKAVVPEVGICFGGRLLRGNRTTKQTAEGFSGFESFNYPHLAEAGVSIDYHEEFIRRPDARRAMQAHLRLDDSVLIVSLFPGVREDLIRHIVATPHLRAIVMRTYGSGNAPHSPWLISALREAVGSGKVVVNVSQCLQGSVEMGRYGTGYQLKEAGVVSAKDATVEATVTKLMFLLGRYDAAETVGRLMGQSLRGEMTD